MNNSHIQTYQMVSTILIMLPKAFNKFYS